MVAIRYASLDRVDSFGRAVTSVCLEEQFLSNTTGFSESTTLRFVHDIMIVQRLSSMRLVMRMLWDGVISFKSHKNFIHI